MRCLGCQRQFEVPLEGSSKPTCPDCGWQPVSIKSHFAGYRHRFGSKNASVQQGLLFTPQEGRQ